MSYGRMGEAERRPEQGIAALLARSAKVDAPEDALEGTGWRGMNCPPRWPADAIYGTPRTNDSWQTP
jgi:hypothetical protein